MYKLEDNLGNVQCGIFKTKAAAAKAAKAMIKTESEQITPVQCKKYYIINFNHTDRTADVEERWLTPNQKQNYETYTHRTAYTRHAQALMAAYAWEQD